MNKTKFEIIGYEMLHKQVAHYKNLTGRVLVPRAWKKVIVVRVE